MPKLPKIISLLFCIDNSSGRASNQHEILDESTGEDPYLGDSFQERRLRNASPSNGRSSNGKPNAKARVVGSNSASTIRSASSAIKQLQQSQQQHLHQRHNNSNGTTGRGDDSKKGPSGCNKSADPTNLYIRNIPPSMSQDGLNKLLSTYGSVVSERILYDLNNSSRGIGFARMTTREECKKIIEQLNGRHCEGWKKPLIIDFADDRHFHGSNKNINCIGNRDSDGHQDNNKAQNRSNTSDLGDVSSCHLVDGFNQQQNSQKQPQQGQRARRWRRRTSGKIHKSLSVSDVEFASRASTVEMHGGSAAGQPVARCSGTGAQSQQNHNSYGKRDQNNRNKTTEAANNNCMGNHNGPGVANGSKPSNSGGFQANSNPKSQSTQNLAKRGRRMQANFY